MNIFKIRSKKTGLFSTGGTTPHFKKVGKIWKRKGDLTCHLLQVRGNVYMEQDAEVVEYVIREEEANAIPVAALVTVITSKLKKKKEDAAEREEKRLRSLRYKTYQQLKNEFEE